MDAHADFRGQPPTLFISYRRSDTGGWAQLLYSSLKNWIDRGDLFLDVVNLRSDCDLEAELDSAVSSCIGLIALIGPNWLCGIEKDDDWVRREIRTALLANKRILLVFVDSLAAPPLSAVPADIHEMFLESPKVHLNKFSYPLNVDAIAEWANRIPHCLKLLGIPFHRTTLERSSERNPGAFYVSEELLTVECWAARLRKILPGFEFDAPRKSTSFAVTELLLKIEQSIKCAGISHVRIDLPFIDEIERAALSGEQLCRDRTSKEFAAMGAGSLITRLTGLTETSRPVRLVLRSIDEVTTHGA